MLTTYPSAPQPPPPPPPLDSPYFLTGSHNSYHYLDRVNNKERVDANSGEAIKVSCGSILSVRFWVVWVLKQCLLKKSMFTTVTMTRKYSNDKFVALRTMLVSMATLPSAAMDEILELLPVGAFHQQRRVCRAFWAATRTLLTHDDQAQRRRLRFRVPWISPFGVLVGDHRLPTTYSMRCLEQLFSPPSVATFGMVQRVELSPQVPIALVSVLPPSVREVVLVRYEFGNSNSGNGEVGVELFSRLSGVRTVTLAECKVTSMSVLSVLLRNFPQLQDLRLCPLPGRCGGGGGGRKRSAFSVMQLPAEVMPMVTVLECTLLEEFSDIPNWERIHGGGGPYYYEYFRNEDVCEGLEGLSCPAEVEYLHAHFPKLMTLKVKCDLMQRSLCPFLKFPRLEHLELEFEAKRQHPHPMPVLLPSSSTLRTLRVSLPPSLVPVVCGLRSLRTLQLGFSRLSVSEMTPLFTSLPAITALNLANSGLSDEHLVHEAFVGNRLLQSQLQRLDVSWNALEGAGGAIAAIGRMTALRFLDLGSNRIPYSVMQPLSELTKLTSLSYFQMCSNESKDLPKNRGWFTPLRRLQQLNDSSSKCRCDGNAL